MIGEIGLDSLPVGNPAYALQEDAGGWAVIVNLDVPTGLALNSTGLLIWRLVNGVRTVGDIIEETAKCFIDAPPTLEDDVRAILDILLDTGLIGYEVNL